MRVPSSPGNCRGAAHANSGQVDELWDSMCQAAMSLTSRALNDVSTAEVLLKIKGFIAVFIQTMEVE